MFLKYKCFLCNGPEAGAAYYIFQGGNNLLIAGGGRREVCYQDLYFYLNICLGYWREL